MAEWDLDSPSQKRPNAETERPASAAGGPLGQTPDRLPAEPDAPPRPVPPDVRATSPVGTPAGRAPESRVSRARVLLLLRWVAVGILLLLAGAVIGFFVARSQSAGESDELAAAREELAVVERALTQAEERNWMYYQETEALKVQLQQAQSGDPLSSSTTAPGARPASVFGDGVYLVGEDILPGTYDGTVIGEVGYWARLRGTDGIVGSIITNGLPRGPFVLTIVESDTAVELRGVVLTAR